MALRLSQIAAKSGQLQAAITPLEDWVREYQGDVNMRVALSTLFQRAGQMDDAVNSYQKLLKVQPNNVVALNNLALDLSEIRQPSGIGGC